MRERKKLEDTAVGKFLSSKGLDKTLEFAATLGIPGAGALDAIKDALINKKLDGTIPAEITLGFLDAHKMDMEELDKRLMDLASARQMYTQKNEMADLVAKRVINWNLVVIFILVVILIACIKLIEDKTILALISSVVGGIITALQSERLTIINFFFGSSLGSKDKSNLLNK